MWAPHTSLLDSTEAPSTVGQLPDLGDYRLDELLARGGMGVVYRATHRPTGREVAIKTLRLDLVNSRELTERFRREVKAAAIVHPNIMPLLEASEFDGRPFLVMPLAAEGSLAKHIKDYREPKSAAALMAKIARGVAAAHSGGVLHRDLKPANVLLVDGEPLVADFGLAKLVDELDTFSLTHTGSPLGTTPYMAPEQASGAKDDIRRPADIWSMGVMLYEMLTEQRPFDGGNQAATMERIHKIEPPPISSWRPDIDPGLEAIVAVCLEKKPADRYQTADELAADLEKWVAGGTTVAARWRRRARWKTNRRRYGKVAVVCAGLAIAIGLIAWSSIHGDVGGTIRSDDPNSYVPHFADPEARKTLLARIDRDATISLIPNGKAPVYHDWLPINRMCGSLGYRDGTTVVDSSDIALLELAPRTPKYYRMTATMRQVNPTIGSPSFQGLFGGYTSEIIDGNPFDCFFAIVFSESERNERGRVELQFWSLLAQRGGPRVDHSDVDRWELPVADNLSDGFPTRRIGATVFDDRIEVEINSSKVGEVSIELLTQVVADQARALKLSKPLAIKPHLAPCGVAINRSPASIHEFRISPPMGDVK